jgi:multidrug efflux pump subunit AcrA (membrane-fusion protein)
MKKIFKIIIPIIIVIMIVSVAIRLLKLRKAEDAKTPYAKIYPLVVKDITPKKGHIITTLPYIALVKNDKQVMINSKFAGKILKIAPLGAKVKKGDVVLKIDASNLKAKLAQTNAEIEATRKIIQADKISLANLKATHKRTAALLKVKMASIEQYQTEENKISELKAKLIADEGKLKALKIAKRAILTDLAYTTVKSPINGTVSEKMLNVEDNIFPGKPALIITPKYGNYLFIALADNVKKIKFKNKMINLKPLDSTFNGLKTYKADINDTTLIPGEKVNVKVVTFDGNATLVPYGSILRINGKDYVFIVESSTKVKPVQIHVLASGTQGIVTDTEINGKILKAAPDLLLRIKAGYPVKVKG